MISNVTFFSNVTYHHLPACEHDRMKWNFGLKLKWNKNYMNREFVMVLPFPIKYSRLKGESQSFNYTVRWWIRFCDHSLNSPWMIYCKRKQTHSTRMNNFEWTTTLYNTYHLFPPFFYSSHPIPLAYTLLIMNNE